MKDLKLEGLMSDLEREEKDMKQSLKSKAEFSPQEQTSTLKAMKGLLEMLGETQQDPELFHDYLEMVVKVINDAVLSGFLDEELASEMPVTDVDLKYLRGRLIILSKPKNKRILEKFLNEKIEVEPLPMKEEEIESEEIDSNPILEALRRK